MLELQKYKHYDTELEKACIGVCLLEKLAFSRMVTLVEHENMLYDSRHKVVYRAMKKLFDDSLPIDIFTVRDVIINKFKIDTLEGYNVPYYLCVCTNSVVSSANLEYHSIIIYEFWKKRRFLEIKYSGDENLGYDTEKDIQNINNALTELISPKFKKEWLGMDELIIALYQHHDQLLINNGVGLLTGFPSLDKNGGFFGGNMIFLGARPGIGKSAFANSIAVNVANSGKKVGILSLEMNNAEVAARIGAIDTDTDFSIIYRGLMTDELETMNMYNKLNTKTIGLPIFVSDKTDVNITDIRRKAEVLKSKQGVDFLIIDYLQLIETSEFKNSNRENEVAKISRGIKIIAKDLNIPVLVLGQLNREVTKRSGANRYPVLGDIRESGAIEQDSDIVFFLHSDFKSGILVDEDGNSTENNIDLVNRKWRNYPSEFIVPLKFDGSKMKFSELHNYSNLPPRPITNYDPETENPF